MAGNAVVAKPAPATPLIAHAMARVLHEAGVPAAVLQLTPADGPPFGEVALTHPALAGVAFTGSTATAATINRTLAKRDGADRAAHRRDRRRQRHGGGCDCVARAGGR